jgi:hypothetical protein
MPPGSTEALEAFMRTLSMGQKVFYGSMSRQGHMKDYIGTIMTDAQKTISDWPCL